jgi:hypothetical protein
VENPREAAAYSFGYNSTLFAQRTHDVLTLVRFLRTSEVEPHPSPTSVAVAGFGHAGPIVAAARAVAGDAIDRAAVDTSGFRFGKLLDFRDPQFLPGGAKYLDLPGMLALAAPQPLWLAGETSMPHLVSDAYKSHDLAKQLVIFSGDASEMESEGAKWLISDNEE